MRTRRAALSLLAIACCSVLGCVSDTAGPLQEYGSFATEIRTNSADGFVQNYLKPTRFPNGELDDFPAYAIILYEGDPIPFLRELGYERDRDYLVRQLGVSIPNTAFIFHATETQPAFALNQGLPGAGGVSTQAAALAALGARYIVHVGICGLLGPAIREGRIIIAEGAYKDGAAVMLTHSQDGQVAKLSSPDPSLTTLLRDTLGPKALSAVGYTVPLFYYQPLGLQEQLLRGEGFEGGPAATFLEMEQSPFFETCRRAGVAGASLVSGSDRMILVDDQVQWIFHDMKQALPKAAMVRAAISAFRRLDITERQ